MQKSYFYSASKREEFLINLLTSISLHQKGDAKTNPLEEAQSSHGFVYFIRNGDLYKIGITGNMIRRIGEIKPDEILNIVRCRNYQEVERSLHSKFKDIRLPQSEYFRMQAQHIADAHIWLTELAEF